MNKIYGLIKSEGICSFLKRVFCSVKRRIDIKLYFLRSVKWNEKKLDLQRNADHKKNILDGNYTKTGVGMFTFNGYTYRVQYFWGPKKSA